MNTVLNIDNKQTTSKKQIVITFLVITGIFLIGDFVYKTINNISYINREKCILYQMLPGVGALVVEYFVEIFIVVFWGIFIAVILEQYFNRYKKIYPRNPFIAFAYGSLLPACACVCLPVAKTMKEKMDMKTIVAFVIAAPLLNPYIIVLSINVLGMRYALLRMFSSFLLAVSAGYIVERFEKIINKNSINQDPVSNHTCNKNKKGESNTDIFDKVYTIFKSIIIYIILGGILGVFFELHKTNDIDYILSSSNFLTGSLLIILFEVPFYFCNGADVLLIRPFYHNGVSLGTVLAFSLTSTSICITSILMLFNIIGKKLAFFLIFYLVICSLLISQIIN